jgi:hypothetical protein
LFPDSAVHANAVRSSTASRHVCFAVVFRFAIIRSDDKGMAVLIATKNQWRNKSESRFSSTPDSARMPTANREPPPICEDRIKIRLNLKLIVS